MAIWFIGDGVIVRYTEKEVLRIRPHWGGKVGAEGRYYTVTMYNKEDHVVLKASQRDDLIEALKLGEEWIP